MYPALQQAGVESFRKEEATQEHAEAATMLDELREEVDNDGEFTATLTELVDAVHHHVMEEERHILPEFRSKADAAFLDELGRKFEQGKKEHMKAA